MSNKNFIPGQTLEINALVITPDRIQTFTPDGRGGGYSSHGDGWGAQEGPRRGESVSTRPREIALPNIMSEFMNEQIHNQAQIEHDYNPRIQNAIVDTENEWQRRRKIENPESSLSLSERIKLDQRITLDYIHGNQQAYLNTAPLAYQLRGQSPYFLMGVVPRQMMRELLNSGQLNQDILMSTYAAFDSAYKSALELKILSTSIDVLSEKLPELARQQEMAEQRLLKDHANWQLSRSRKIELIMRERDIHAQRLPNFLRSELINLAGPIENLTLTESLTRYKTVLDQMATAKQAQIQPIHAPPSYTRGGVTVHYPPNNPNINAPLSKPELEALHDLVNLQHHTAIGKKWITYHEATLKSESARHLTRISSAFMGLVERSARVDQVDEANRLAALQKQPIAKTQAEAMAAVLIGAAIPRASGSLKAMAAAHAIKTANTFRIPIVIATHQSVIAMAPGINIVAESRGLLLQAAIRSAVATLGAFVASTAAGLMLGVVALTFPSRLGNSELPEHYRFSTPLSDLIPDSTADLANIDTSTSTIDLPFRVASGTNLSGQSELIVVKTDGVTIPSRVRVVSATYDLEQNTYTYTTHDQPPRTLIWTPTASPPDSSTSLPEAQPAPQIYSGTQTIPFEGRLDTHPGFAEAGFDDYVLIFPQDSGLPPLYLMFRDRRDEPGTATGYGQPVMGNWLTAAASKEGAPIPAQIANLLRGREFKNVKDFREALWNAVANDPGLNIFFSRSNLRIMREWGHAPYPPPKEQVGGRVKYEIHHVIYLRDGGEVYDIDNLRILTPRHHIDTHRNLGERK